MNCLLRSIFPLGTLVFLAGSLFAADGFELKERWIVGKRYYQTTETIQTNNVILAAGPREQLNSTTLETSAEVRAGEKGKGKRMTAKITRVAMEISSNGKGINFDSSKPGEGNDPRGVGKIMASVIGKEVRISLNEKDEITDVENYDELMKGLSSSAAGVDMSKVISKESLIQMVNGHAFNTAPANPVKPGDGWAFSKRNEFPQFGNVNIAGNYMFKGMTDHDGIEVAEVIVDATVSVDSQSADSSKAAAPKADKFATKMQNGSIKGRIWFDPKIGFARETQITQEVTVTKRNFAEASGTMSIHNKQINRAKLTKIEDLE